jgi:hypothetical protein
MSGFEASWRRHYPHHHPVGYMMRWGGAEHWLRFHSLPSSKRHADTHQERQILLARQNELAKEVLGADATCWLVQACWVTPEGMIDYANELDPFRACREFKLTFAWRFRASDEVKTSDEDEDPREHFWDIQAGLHQWKNGVFDELLLAIADERAAPTLWFSSVTGSVFAPYDGGIDLFLPAVSMVERLASAHRDWLPFLSYGH